MFDLDRFFADCQDAVTADPSHKLVRDVVARAVSEPATVLGAIGEPQRAGIKVMFHAPNLTVLNVIWGPGMTIMPHDHRMWAVIGVYTGREDNIYWRRLPADADRGIEAAGARSLCRGDCTPLGADHVYGGDFLQQERSEWDPETLHERPYDVAKAMRLFADSNPT